MYEIPAQLKRLYAHWPDHAAHAITQESKRSSPHASAALLTDIDAFIAERMNIWHKRETNATQPYTTNPILRDYRFCNIYRELDRQTIEFHTLLKPLTDDFERWLLNMAFCRFVCAPATVQDVGLLSFSENENAQVRKRLEAHARPKYGVAYLFPISTIQRSDTPTRELFFTVHLPRVIQKIAALIKDERKASVCDLLAKILPLFGFNLAFHWTEILIDVAYQYPQYVDLYKRFPIGPGSAPTMCRLDPCAPPEETNLALTAHQAKDFPYLAYDGRPIPLSAENWEGIGCEFRKYTNLKNGSGRRRKYVKKDDLLSSIKTD